MTEIINKTFEFEHILILILFYLVITKFISFLFYLRYSETRKYEISKISTTRQQTVN